MLRDLGKVPEVFHLNEGHAGFLALERIRRAMLDDGLSFAEARTAIRPGAVFTTHTPVPAGIDRFSRELMEKYFGNWCRDCGLGLDDLMALGHEPGTPEGEVFNMATLSLRLAGTSNGVSALHGDVSRRMFAGIWPDVPVAEVPISSVTNGVHARTWTSPEMSALYERLLGADWPEAPAEEWRQIEASPTATCGRPGGPGASGWWPTPGAACTAPSWAGASSESQVAWTDQVLDPEALTIGFARRFATYKRATLLFRDMERLRTLLLDAERPVQLIFAGKAHPADDQGKELLQQVAKMSADLDLRGRLVLLEDYDITVARMLVAGVDVWLNTPLRPLEACGTSGMKAVFNGVLNCSVLDGWWDEMYDGDVGWAIPSAEWEDDVEARNDLEAASVFNLLERQVVPLFYARTDGLPVDWLRKVKASMARLGPRVGASRMLREYTTDLYEPAAQRERALRADHDERVKALVRWRAPHRPGLAVGGGDRHLPRAARPARPHHLPGGGAGRRWATSTPPTWRCSWSTAPSTSTTSCAIPQITAMAEDGAGEHPGWRRYTPSSTSTGPATSASPCASSRPTPTCAATPTSARWPGRLLGPLVGKPPDRRLRHPGVIVAAAPVWRPASGRLISRRACRRWGWRRRRSGRGRRPC